MRHRPRAGTQSYGQQEIIWPQIRTDPERQPTQYTPLQPPAPWAFLHRQPYAGQAAHDEETHQTLGTAGRCGGKSQRREPRIHHTRRIAYLWP